jgi:hypothetical protein
MMDDIENYPELTVDMKEFEKKEVEALSLRKLYTFRKIQEQ